MSGHVKVTVGTNDLRAAIAAVVPHAPRPGADADWMCRVRFVVDPVNVTLSATDRYTIGCALVSTTEEPDGRTPYTFDLLPGDCQAIAAVFKPGKDDIDSAVTIEAGSTEVVVTEAGALFPGRSLTVTPAGESSEPYPDAPRILRAALLSTRAELPWHFYSAAKLARFTAAGRAYGEPLAIRRTDALRGGRPHAAVNVVTCGESFIGAIMPIRRGDDDEVEHSEIRRAWVDRFESGRAGGNDVSGDDE